MAPAAGNNGNISLPQEIVRTVTNLIIILAIVVIVKVVVHAVNRRRDSRRHPEPQGELIAICSGNVKLRGKNLIQGRVWSSIQALQLWSPACSWEWSDNKDTTQRLKVGSLLHCLNSSETDSI